MELNFSIEAVVVQAGIKIKRKGSTLMALCPFHYDKQPSMAIYPDKQRFICFACSEKGSAVDFVMKHQNITFKEAVKRLWKDPPCFFMLCRFWNTILRF